MFTEKVLCSETPYSTCIGECLLALFCEFLFRRKYRFVPFCLFDCVEARSFWCVVFEW